MLGKGFEGRFAVGHGIDLESLSSFQERSQLLGSSLGVFRKQNSSFHDNL